MASSQFERSLLSLEFRIICKRNFLLFYFSFFFSLHGYNVEKKVLKIDWQVISQSAFDLFFSICNHSEETDILVMSLSILRIPLCEYGDIYKLFVHITM